MLVVLQETKAVRRPGNEVYQQGIIYKTTRTFFQEDMNHPKSAALISSWFFHSLYNVS